MQSISIQLWEKDDWEQEANFVLNFIKNPENKWRILLYIFLSKQNLEISIKYK